MKRRWLPFALAIIAIAATTGAQQQPATSPATGDMLTIGVSARKLLWDSKRRQILALVADSANSAESSDAKILPSRIAIIDPVRGAVEGSILIGERPSDLVIDPDGVYLYAALWTRGVIRRFRLADRAWDLDIPVAPNDKPTDGKPPIRAMAALPGKPGVLMVALKLREGFGIWIVANVLWVWFAFTHKHWGLLFLSTCYLFINLYGFLTW